MRSCPHRNLKEPGRAIDSSRDAERHINDCHYLRGAIRREKWPFIRREKLELSFGYRECPRATGRCSAHVSLARSQSIPLRPAATRSGARRLAARANWSALPSAAKPLPVIQPRRLPTTSRCMTILAIAIFAAKTIAPFRLEPLCTLPALHSTGYATHTACE